MGGSPEEAGPAVGTDKAVEDSLAVAACHIPAGAPGEGPGEEAVVRKESRAGSSLAERPAEGNTLVVEGASSVEGAGSVEGVGSVEEAVEGAVEGVEPVE